MKINEIVNLDEAPGDQAGRRIGNAFGTLAKGVGAVAGGIAGAGRAAKKGFQQGRDVVGQGGDAPLDAPELEKGAKATGSDGDTYTWQGAQWTNDETGRVATKDVAADLNKPNTSSNTSGGSTGGTAPTGGDAGSDAGKEAPSGPQDGMKATYGDAKNKSNWTYNAGTGQWTDDKTGEVAKGKLSQDLFKSQGLNPDGSPAKKSIKQRVGDYFSGKSGGLAQATRKDPNSSIGRKIAGVAGAGIAKALGGPEPTAQGSQYTELPKEIKAQIDNLTKSEKNYLMDKLGQIDTSKRGEDNVQLVRGGGK